MSYLAQGLESAVQSNLDLLFLPGASGQTEFWQPVVTALSAYPAKRIVAYPSFAGYPADPEVNSFESLQAYVIDQVTAPSVLIAQSMGGIFAVQAALQKSQQIKGLVLVATSGGIDLSAFSAQDWREEYQQAFDLPDWFAVTKSQGVAQALAQIRCPVLLIWGDQDPISPVTVGQYLAQQLHDAQLHIVTTGEHDLAKVHATQVSALIATFLETIV